MTTTTEETKRLQDAATPGKWERTFGGEFLADEINELNLLAPNNLDFVLHAVNNIFAVCKERDALKLEVEKGELCASCGRPFDCYDCDHGPDDGVA